MGNGDLRYGREAEDLLGNLVEDFKKNLSRITRRLAHHERAETVDCRHVTNAFESMIRCGLDRTPWWKRPQLKITVSGALVGAALATPDVATLLSANPQYSTPLAWIGIICFSVAGLGVYVWGWLQNSL